MSYCKIAMAVAATLALTACGSTVEVRGSAQVLDRAGQVGPQQGQLGDASGPGAGGQGAVAPGQGPAQGGSAPIPTAGGTGAASLPTPTSTAATGNGIPAKGRGWDEKNVYIGLTTVKDFDQTIGSLGLSLSTGDQVGDANAIVDALNRTGGLFGRKVKILQFDMKTADLEANTATVAQAACTHFTQDASVIGVLAIGPIDTDNFRACMTKGKVPFQVLTSNYGWDDVDGRATLPYMYNTSAISWTRVLPVFIARLKARNYFAPWDTINGGPGTGPVKVGVLYGPSAGQVRMGKNMIAGFQHAGYAVEGYQYHDQSDLNAAVLKFHGDGVTHVTGVDEGPFYFSTEAESQHYRPRYALTTFQAVEPLWHANGSPAQNAGALGIGWSPGLDVDNAHDPGPSPNTAWCLKALGDGGQQFASRFARFVGLVYCDAFESFAKGAIAGGGLDPLSIFRGLVTLGAKFPLGSAFTSGITRTNLGLPGTARDFAWSVGCTCFTYSGAPYPV